jgi:hypothetical protein
MKGTQFVIAVFDDWSAIASALKELGTDRIGRLGALLHMRSDGPPVLAVSWLVQDMTELHFATSRKRVRCTTGKIAAQLATRSAGGAHDLAHALQSWVSPGHAKELQWHVESGRLVLLLQPARSEDFEGICALMVQASPHLVELCDLEFNP